MGELPTCWELTRKKSCLEELEIASLLDLRDDCRPIDVTQTCPGAWSKIPPQSLKGKTEIQKTNCSWITGQPKKNTENLLKLHAKFRNSRI